MARPTVHVRRNQAERSATTQKLLLDTTIECLVEVGYARLTQTYVAQRAGLSVGALVHHFPTKAMLLAAALEELLDRRQASFKRAMASIPDDADRLDAALDAMWTLYKEDTFIAWLELWVAARRDPELAEVIAQVDRRFLASSATIYDEILPPRAGFDEPAVRRGGFYSMFALLDGLAMGRLQDDYSPYDPEEVLAVWKGMIKLSLDALAE